MSYVYVIGREAGPVKIGISDNPDNRLQQLKSGCPFKPAVIWQHSMPMREDAFAIERAFHAKHANRRLHGEWFNMDWEAASDTLEEDIANYMREGYPGVPY